MALTLMLTLAGCASVKTVVTGPGYKMEQSGWGWGKTGVSKLDQNLSGAIVVKEDDVAVQINSTNKANEVRSDIDLSELLKYLP